MPAKPSELDLNDAPARASKLFLVDANGLMYRAFYALPEEIATSAGEPTNALLGFANMLVKLLTTYRPQGVLVCWDEKPTHRLEMHPDYKASRRPMPDLLREQRPHFRPLVEAFGYENFSVAGLGGRRRDRHALAHRRRGRRADVRRVDRPRRVPAGVRQRLPDDDAARRRGPAGLHAGARGGAARHPARAACPTTSA